MSNHHHPDDSPAETGAETTEETLEDRTAQIELLREENRRLRTRFAQTRRTEYRRAALGVGALGVVAALGGLVFPATRAPLFALAGIGVFTAVLTYYLTPERFVAASVGERTYAARATLGDALVADLGLQDTRVYVPRGPTAPDAANVTLFVPQHVAYTVPDDEALDSVVVVPPDDRAHGVALPPTGAPLFREFEQTMVNAVADTPGALADQLTEALVQGFELADDAVVARQSDTGRLTVGIRGSTFGAVARFDHPIVSFIATGLATGLETPVRVDTVRTDDERFDYLLTYTWEAETEADPNTESDTEAV